ncbi:hypothetical protein NC651_029054 [Populus alba x Populus x berolinensis]|nr:hypothetical protein NC651_029054 [Populus alba x Populus x berolinensis]
MVKPSTSRSVLAIERPRVLRPGKSAAMSRVSDERKKLSVSPGLLSFDDLKSEATMLFGFLQGKPLMKTVCLPVVAVGQVS